MPAPLFAETASRLAERIRRREITSRDVIEAHLARIDAVEPRVNALSVRFDDAARRAADAADRALAAGEAVGPLHGVPVALKESIDQAGVATTSGCEAFRDHVVAEDAPFVARWRAAGAIPIARTNMPDIGMRYHTANPLFGATLNPWDSTRTPGGSSGGAAAALASGMCPLAHGSDIAGSLRWPAQCCGVVALRPSLGRIASHSDTRLEQISLASQLFLVQGPMARSVEDVELGLACAMGASPLDPWSLDAPLREGLRPLLRRAGVIEDAGFGIEPAVRDGIRRAADALAAAGFEVERVDPPSVREGYELYNTILRADLGAATPLAAPLLSPPARRVWDWWLALGREVDLAGYREAIAPRRAAHAIEWAQLHERFPIVLGPVSSAGPFLADEDASSEARAREIFDSLALTVVVALLGLPSLALPVGVAGGLPQGVQLIAPRLREDVALDAGHAIESRLGTFTPIDPRG